MGIYHYTKGCQQAVVDTLTSSIGVVGGIGIAIAVIQVGGSYRAGRGHAGTGRDNRGNGEGHGPGSVGVAARAPIPLVQRLTRRPVADRSAVAQQIVALILAIFLVRKMGNRKSVIADPVGEHVEMKDEEE